MATLKERLATIRERLGDDRFERGWREGERLGLRGAIDEAARTDELA